MDCLSLCANIVIQVRYSSATRPTGLFAVVVKMKGSTSPVAQVRSYIHTITWARFLNK